MLIVLGLLLESFDAHNFMLLCISPHEAEIIKPLYALCRQLPRAILLDLF